MCVVGRSGRVQGCGRVRGLGRVFRLGHACCNCWAADGGAVWADGRDPRRQDDRKVRNQRSVASRNEWRGGEAVWLQAVLPRRINEGGVQLERGLLKWCVVVWRRMWRGALKSSPVYRNDDRVLRFEGERSRERGEERIDRGKSGAGGWKRGAGWWKSGARGRVGLSFEWSISTRSARDQRSVAIRQQ